LDESLEMCRVAYRDGVRTIVATPHMLNGVYRSTRAAILSRTQELNAALSRSENRLKPQSVNRNLQSPFSAPDPRSPLRILSGADVHLAEGILHHLKRDRLMTLGDGKKFILIEFPSQVIPYLAEKVLFQMIVQGIIPILLIFVGEDLVARLVSQVVQQEALTRLLVEKGIFTKEEFLGMVKVVDRERKRKAK
jgi:protein-tyrosine phosphatase